MDIKSFLNLLLAIGLFGVIVWLILQLPMPSQIKNVIMGLAVVGLVLYLLSGFGVIHTFVPIRIIK